jgi:hypothetical protein
MLPSRSGRSRNRSWFVSFLSILFLAILLLAGPTFAQGRGGKKKKMFSATPSVSPGERSLTNIPLPIGHEAKGLVLPDFGTDGRLRGKFEAKTARRVDEEHVGFQDLAIVTYTPENRPDLTIYMHTSILNLKTRILSSPERTMIKRADFNITGDSVEFDTNTRTGHLVGNVKMVITQQSQLLGKENE